MSNYPKITTEQRKELRNTMENMHMELQGDLFKRGRIEAIAEVLIENGLTSKEDLQSKTENFIYYALKESGEL